MFIKYDTGNIAAVMADEYIKELYQHETGVTVPAYIEGDDVFTLEFDISDIKRLEHVLRGLIRAKGALYNQGVKV